MRHTTVHKRRGGGGAARDRAAAAPAAAAARARTVDAENVQQTQPTAHCALRYSVKGQYVGKV